MILGTATSLVGLLTILIAVIGSVAYASNTREIVLMNLSYGILSNVIQLAYATSVLCSFALQLYPLVEVLKRYQTSYSLGSMLKT